MFYKNDPLSILLNDLNFAASYEIFILPETPPEPPAKKTTAAEENKLDEKQFHPRSDWNFHDSENLENWRMRKRQQWEKYAGRLVIVEHEETAAPISIFFVDEFSNTMKVSIAHQLLNEFKMNLEELKEMRDPEDYSLTLYQIDFIGYISCYTGFHAEYGDHFAKGMSTEGVLRTLANTTRVTHHHYYEPNCTGRESSSPVSGPTSPSGINERKSPISPYGKHKSVFRSDTDKLTGVQNDDLYSPLGLLRS